MRQISPRVAETTGVPFLANRSMPSCLRPPDLGACQLERASRGLSPDTGIFSGRGRAYFAERSNNGTRGSVTAATTAPTTMLRLRSHARRDMPSACATRKPSESSIATQQLFMRESPDP